MECRGKRYDFESNLNDCYDWATWMTAMRDIETDQLKGVLQKERKIDMILWATSMITECGLNDCKREREKETFETSAT